MSLNFNSVTAADVKSACLQAIKDGVPAGRQGRSTFVLHDGHRLPAKYILGLAYELATGETLRGGDFTGGRVSGAILERLEFQVMYKAQATQPRGRSRSRALLSKSQGMMNGKPGFLRALRMHYGQVQTEVTFPWMQVPLRDELSPAIWSIRSALAGHRGMDDFDTPGYQLRCDFFLPAENTIIEVDERQHFTKPRALALRHYPSGIGLGFDRELWVQECERIAATDPSPPFRDEQRAYYDSLRDLLAVGHGIPVVRLPATSLSNSAGIAKAVSVVAEASESPTRARGKSARRMAGGSVPAAMITRVVVRGRPPRTPRDAAATLFDAFGERWAGHGTSTFVLTSGGFLTGNFPEKWKGGKSWTSRSSDLDDLVKHAAPLVEKMLEPRLLESARRRADIMTVGVDLTSDDYRAELVAVVDLGRETIVQWTGKSYPVGGWEERHLVQVVDLDSHLLEIRNERVLVLGCHDLNMFSERSRANQSPHGLRRQRCDAMVALARRFKPTIVLQHPHSTDSPNIWRTAWAGLTSTLPCVRTWASGIAYFRPQGRRRQPLRKVLIGTRSTEDVMDVVVAAH